VRLAAGQQQAVNGKSSCGVLLFDGIELLNGMTRMVFYIKKSLIVNKKHFLLAENNLYFSCHVEK
jgi:hypothetical protein